MHRVAWVTVLLYSVLVSVQGSEVYLQDITIFKTHDPSIAGRFSTPSIYFYCEHDGRTKTQLDDVTKTNHTYTYKEEATVLTHVDIGQCRQECGIKDADVFSKDDLFGHTFPVCDSDFGKNDHLLQVVIPTEVTLTLFCPECNPSGSPPLDPPPPAIADGSPSRRGTTVASIVFAAVLVGIMAGVCVTVLVRAWHDDEAEEARQRFHSLYADPATDIEDLPASMPRIRQKTTMLHFAHWLRQSWLKVRGKGPYQSLAELPPGNYV